ncbi:hypothetical protein LWI29_024037 [Acer saccharum]|uniref:Uncharacterized protein n=1 Tax=Acer saccharum TaxID=4024 RepID=A0AA39SQU3_ACESA|nr:hypothetical protein LWI29_024037 [Acer saccharum]
MQQACCQILISWYLRILKLDRLFCRHQKEVARKEPVSKILPENGRNTISDGAVIQESEEDEILSVVEDPMVLSMRGLCSGFQLPIDRTISREINRSVFEVDCIPLWGSVSICGRRPEMEDAVAAVPRFMKIPIKMLIGDRVIDGMSQSLSGLNGHFFGVYDGHGRLSGC